MTSILHRLLLHPDVSNKFSHCVGFHTFTKLLCVDRQLVDNASHICQQLTVLVLPTQEEAAVWLACPYQFSSLHTLFMMDNADNSSSILSQNKVPKLTSLVIRNGTSVELDSAVAEQLESLSCHNVRASSGILKHPLPNLKSADLSTSETNATYRFIQSNLETLLFETTGSMVDIHLTLKNKCIIENANKLQCLCVKSVETLQLCHSQQLVEFRLDNVHTIQLDDQINSLSFPHLEQISIENVYDKSFFSRFSPSSLPVLMNMKIRSSEPKLDFLQNSPIQALEIADAVGSYSLPNLPHLRLLKLHSHHVGYIESFSSFPMLEYLEFKCESGDVFSKFFSKFTVDTAPLLRMLVFRCACQRIDLSIFSNLHEIVIRPKYEDYKKSSSSPIFQLICSPKAPVQTVVIENYFNYESILGIFNFLNMDEMEPPTQDIRLEDPNLKSNRHFQQLELHNIPNLRYFECADRFLKHEMILENVPSEPIEDARNRHKQIQLLARFVTHFSPTPMRA